MRFTLGLALLLTLVLLGNAAGPPESGSEDSGSDDSGEEGAHPAHTGDNAATVLTPTIFPPSHNSVFWSGLAFTGVAWAMYGA